MFNKFKWNKANVDKHLEDHSEGKLDVLQMIFLVLLYLNIHSNKCRKFRRWKYKDGNKIQVIWLNGNH